MDEPLQSAAAKIAMAYAVCCELAKHDGSVVEQAMFVTILQHPLFALSAPARAAVESATEQDLITALWREFASQRYDAALGRPTQATHQPN